MDVIAAGAIDLRHLQLLKDGERARYFENSYTPWSTFNENLFKKHTKMKIRVVLLGALKLGFRDLVLGALGCGAFLNPPETVAACFEEVLLEPHFNGFFRNVIFAVMGEPNFGIFSIRFPAMTHYSQMSSER